MKYSKGSAREDGRCFGALYIVTGEEKRDGGANCCVLQVIVKELWRRILLHTMDIVKQWRKT